MTLFKNVLHDLIEKRLWPVAVALLVALVAVPIVLGRGSDATPTASGPLADASVAGAQGSPRASKAQVISLQEQAAGKVQRAGKHYDPFVQHHQPKAETTETTVTNAVQTTKTLADALSGSAGGSSPSGGNGSSGPAVVGSPGATPAPAATTPPDAPKKDANPEDVYDVTLKFGEEGAEKTFKNVARLTPLPSSDNPFFVYLGLQDDKKHAVFLINEGAVPSGDGHCLPSPQQCEQVTLGEGDIEFFELQSGTAGVVEYQLELTTIGKVKVKSKAVAAKAHARESRAGREYLRELVADDPDVLESWDYSKHLGVLVHKDAATTPDVANVPQSVADGATGQAVQQTSTVLTVPSS